MSIEMSCLIFYRLSQTGRKTTTDPIRPCNFGPDSPKKYIVTDWSAPVVSSSIRVLDYDRLASASRQDGNSIGQDGK